jgi:penicillin amidase
MPKPNPFLQAIHGLTILARSWLTRSPQPQRQGQVHLPGLSAPVKIIRDHWDVPHIYGQTDADALFGQGYVHAQERLWQMDFNRRLTAGRLSEILGSAAVPLDRWIRILGLRRVAEQQPPLVEPEMRVMFDAYCAGVNAFIAAGRRPIEFALLNYQPEPWTMIDSMAWAKMMAWDLGVNWETEILRARLAAQIGPELAAELEPPYLRDWPRTVPPGVDYSCIGNEALRRAAEARKFTGPAPQDGLGSNNWVVAGARTQTGQPLLANDMHLGLSAPAIWFENHLIGDTLNVTGVSFPGLPGVVAGHNAHVAWGYTNGFNDVQDIYLEHLRTVNDGRVQYEFKGEWLDAEMIHEAIRVKDADPVVETVIVTQHGPILNALAPDFMGEQPLALRWTALEPDNIFGALLRLNRAQNCAEVREALRYWSAPTQNTVYADVQGNIGYSFPGKTPIRAKGRGRVPVPGWTGEYEWLGYVPFEELPHVYNPPQGYVATANNRVTDDDYPHWIGYDHSGGSRAERIAQLIEAHPKLSVADMQKMHLDQISMPALRVVASLNTLTTDDPELAAALKGLREWDGQLGAPSAPAAVYEVFVRRLIERLLSKKLGADLITLQK